MTPWNLQWLNHNAQRSYPLTTDATKQDETGAITLPNSFLVGLQLCVHADLAVDPERFYLQQLLIDANGYTLGIGYDDDSLSPPLIAAAGVSRSLHTEYTSYALTGRGDFDDAVGRVVIGQLTEIDQLPPGNYTFARAGGNLEVDAIKPALRGVTSLTVRNGGDLSGRITGDVVLSAYRNMRLAVNIVEDAPTQILFSAIRGEGLNEECDCDDDEEQGPCIRFINGIGPLPDSNFRIVGDDCQQLEPIANGLQLIDTCSSPCCGCRELDAITQQLQRFSDGITTLEGFAAALDSRVLQTEQLFFASRLGDDGCLSCE